LYTGKTGLDSNFHWSWCHGSDGQFLWDHSLMPLLSLFSDREQFENFGIMQYLQFEALQSRWKLYAMFGWSPFWEQ
jgi:hypothetical protein